MHDLARSPSTSTRWTLTSGVPLDDLRHIVENMRSRDWDEIRACLWDDDKERFVFQFDHAVKQGGMAWTARWDGKPVAIVALIPMWPGLYQAGMFATSDFPKVAMRLTRALQKSIIPVIGELREVRRVQCHSIEGYDEAHRWLLSLGAEKEAVIPNYGRNGESFVTFSWNSDHVRRRQQ
jgi:hypothetical protein